MTEKNQIVKTIKTKKSNIKEKITKTANKNNNGQNLDKLYNQYFKWQINFQEKYGEKTVVLCEVGAFFEIYGIDNDFEKIGVADEVAKLLNIQCTLKNKKLVHNNRKNPKMAGFQPPYLQRHLEILLAQNWTVVIVEQITPPPNPKRDITRIYSPGTYLDFKSKPDNNYIASLYFDYGKSYKSQMDIILVGISALDVSTGENVIHCFNSQELDLNMENNIGNKKSNLLTVEEEIFRFMEIYNPKEVIVNSKEFNQEMVENLLYSLDLSDRIIYYDTLKNESNNIFNVSYQNQFLEKIFPNTGYLEPIEFIDLAEYPQGVMSYLLLLKFIYEHSPKIVEKINVPTKWALNNNLILKNNTIYQLDVLPGHQIDTHHRYKSLLHVIDKAKTPMGKRLLRYQLLNPIFNVDELEKRYDSVESVRKLEIVKPFRQLLEDIMDIERCHRKMFLKILQPYQLAEMEMSYQSIICLFKLVREHFKLEDFKFLEEDINNFDAYFNDYQTIFNLEEMIKYSFKNVDRSFFHKGHFEVVDAFETAIENTENELFKMADKFSDLIEKNSNYVTLEKTDKEGYFFKITTQSRVDTLKKKLSEEERNGLSFKKLSSSSVTKIYLKDSDLLEKYAELKKDIKEPLIKAYNQTLENLFNKYGNMLNKLSRFVAQIDVIISHAKSALEFAYFRPKIIDKLEGQSYLDAKELRHPIAERIHTKVNYVPNDVKLGLDEKDGFLLFGINSAGKSCLLKSVGLSVIMAQMGMYVPSSDFEYYPFQTIFTRISGDDNMFKGKSSYTIEMQEMRTIVREATPHSLVLGDEICKGTEHISALSIVAASLKWMAQKRVKFILATHLHQLSEMPQVTELPNMDLKHLEIRYDQDEECFVYDRKLKDGSGDSIYGLEVAKYIIKEKEFIEWASQIRNGLLGKQTILEAEKSNYNPEVYKDVCQICGTKDNIDEHHIIYQSQCKDGFYKHIPKNNQSNLVFLCKKHHQEVHQDKLIINGWKMTSDGKKLDYKFVDEKITKNVRNQKLKFKPDDIKIVKELKDAGLSQKMILFKLKKNHNIDMSISTLRKIQKGDY